MKLSNFCNEKEASVKLLDILHQHPFDLKISADENTGNYTLDFQFIESDLAFRLDTGKNEIAYPPLQMLKNKQIKFITTGIWTGRSSEGRTCEYDSRLMRFGLFDIGDSFSQANDVQFIAGDSEKEPSIVILTYDDYNHIFNAEADEAYNQLMNMSKGRPLLEIHSVNQVTVNLRIWDILIDLDIHFDGIKYSQKRLDEFLRKTGINDSFGFALGFLPSGRQKVAIASTKSEGFELITLRGYTYKK